MKKIVLTGTMIATAVAMMSASAAQAAHNAYGGGYGVNAVFGPYSNTPIPDDTTTATPTKTENFTLTGNVAKDCSFYAGNTNTQTLSLGAIGVRNGDDETVANLFNQNGQFSYDIGTSTAGCNFNNTVTVTKNANGLTNASAGGYDSTQFQANIPYSIVVGLTATTNQSAGTPGTYIPMNLSLTDSTKSETLGAWRSAMHVTATIPAPSKGLVAGTYSDTIVVTLATS